MASVIRTLDFPVRKTRGSLRKSSRSASKENNDSPNKHNGFRSERKITRSQSKIEVTMTKENRVATEFQSADIIENRTRRQLLFSTNPEDGNSPKTTRSHKRNAPKSWNSQVSASAGDAHISPGKWHKKVNHDLNVTPCKLAKANGSDITFSPSKVLKQNDPSTPKKEESPVSLHFSNPNLSPYQEAKRALHTSVPSRLLCREREMADISQFLDEHLKENKPGSLYIYGNPGTGKTVCLSHLLDVKLSTYTFQSVFVNCMSMKNPALLYKKVASELGCSVAGLTNQDVLGVVERTVTKRGPMCILVLDEIDQLESRNQEVLYTVFDWPRFKSSRLILIGIANTLDLTSRVLPRLRSVGCTPVCLKFNPYNKDQIVAILEDRLKEVQSDGIPVIKPMAIQMCAKKIASCTGDIRRALDMCRRAIEVMEVDTKNQNILKVTCDDRSNPGSPQKSPSKAVFKQVDIPHISRIINQVYGSRVLSSGLSNNTDISNTLPLHEKILICSLLLFKRHTKGPITVGKIQDIYSRICKKREISNFGQSEFINTCALLECKGLITLKRHKETRLSKISLSFDKKEAEHVLRDKVLMSSILSDTSALGK